MKLTNMISRLLAVFGFLLIFGVSGWGANGLTGYYYTNNTSYTGTPTLTQIDSTINVDWGNGSPNALISNDNFSVKWTGYIYIPEKANYTFYVAHDDFMSVTINGTQYYSNGTWTGGSNQYNNFSISNLASGYYPIEIDYIEYGGGAYARFAWKNNKSITSQTIVPSSNLFTTIAIPTLDIGRAFNIRNPADTRNMPGGLAIIGNTVLCNKDSHENCIDYTNGDGKKKSNSELNLKYIDIDGDSSTYDSSQAKLSIPSTATVVWAGLYTQGYMNGKTQAQSTSLLQQNPVYLTIPTVGKVTSYPSNIDLYSNGKSGYSYDTYAPIPQLIGKTATLVNGWITGANIQAFTGTDDSGLGNYGAWTLVVVYSDPNSTLKNISVFDGYKKVANKTGYESVNIPVSGFITPSSGDVHSSLGLFVGEGDKYITGDTLSLSGTSLNSTNAFSSIITGVTTNPTFTNNEGIDIQNFDVGVDGDTSHPQIIGHNISNANITMTSTQDTYFPSMVAFTTELYEPRVCYKQEILDASGNPLTNPQVGDTVTVATWISNMKRDAADSNLENADKVKITVNLDNNNLEYVSNTLFMKNLNESVYTLKTDAVTTVTSDTMDFYSDTNTTIWRVGTGANNSDGGLLTVNATGADTGKAFIKFNAKLKSTGDININNVYKVAYLNPTLGVRVGDDSPINIGVCKDITTSFNVSGLLGAFNVVNASGGGSNFQDPTNAQTSLTTQIVNKPFNVKIISLNNSGDALSSYTGDVKVSLIAQPDYSTCTDDTCKQGLCDSQASLTTPTTYTFTNETSKTVSNFSYSTADTNVAFKVQYTSGSTTKYSCSLDSFAIRPDRFILTTPTGQDSELLKSGTQYNFSLTAAQYGNNSPSIGYTVTGINNSNNMLNLIPALYTKNNVLDNTLHGVLSLSSTSFDITDGQALDVVKLSFDDVAKVNIQFIDKTWAQVDITNGDTAQDCSSTGAWICGNTSATFIPDHFALSGVTLNNNNASSYTYLSNDLNVSARLATTITAQNSLGGTTQNFSTGSWENPVDVNLTLPTISGMTPLKHEISGSANLGFNSGALTIPWDETNSTKQLMFNFARTINDPKNPFSVLGTNVSLGTKSRYTSSSSNTADVTGTSVADQNATFVYARTHAPRYRFPTSSGSAQIYYETYCSSDGNKTMLPTGSIGSSDSVGWYLNPLHNTSKDGNITAVSEKGSSSVTAGTLTSISNGSVSTTLTYGGTIFPYKTTMQFTPSSWLIYDKYNSSATTNDFEVEFYGGLNSWTGKKGTPTGTTQKTTDSDAAPVTNKRILW